MCTVSRPRHHDNYTLQTESVPARLFLEYRMYMTKKSAIWMDWGAHGNRRTGAPLAICGAFGESISHEMTRQSLTNGNTVKLLKTKESDMRYPLIFASYCNGDFGGFLAPKALPRNMVESFVCKQLEGMV